MDKVIARLMKQLASDPDAEFQPPATLAQIEREEASLGCRLPENFRRILRSVNGVDMPYTIHGVKKRPFATIAKNTEDYPVRIDGMIAATNVNIGSFSSITVLLPLHLSNGVECPVYVWGRGTERSGRLADSIKEWLSKYISGEYAEIEEAWDTDEFWDAHPELTPLDMRDVPNAKVYREPQAAPKKRATPKRTLEVAVELMKTKRKVMFKPEHAERNASARTAKVIGSALPAEFVTYLDTIGWVDIATHELLGADKGVRSRDIALRFKDGGGFPEGHRPEGVWAPILTEDGDVFYLAISEGDERVCPVMLWDHNLNEHEYIAPSLGEWLYRFAKKSPPSPFV